MEHESEQLHLWERTSKNNPATIMKNDRWYKRIVRRGIKSVRFEIFLVSIGQNLYKYHNKKMRYSKCA